MAYSCCGNSQLRGCKLYVSSAFYCSPCVCPPPRARLPCQRPPGDKLPSRTQFASLRFFVTGVGDPRHRTFWLQRVTLMALAQSRATSKTPEKQGRRFATRCFVGTEHHRYVAAGSRTLAIMPTPCGFGVTVFIPSIRGRLKPVGVLQFSCPPLA